MKIVIIGADGQLGYDLCRVIPKDEQIPLTINDIDITNKEQTISLIKKLSPEIVINTAAYHKVDDCETNELLAFKVNELGASNVAQACQAVEACMVHFSTDYVFDGTKNEPYLEGDCPNPLSVYGTSKLNGENLVRIFAGKHFIVRSTGLYGVAGCLGKGGGNFVETMLKMSEKGTELKVIDDEIVSPTYTLHLARVVNQLIRTDKYGIYHMVNHGQCSWYAFAAEIFKLLGKKVKLTPISSKEYYAKAKRPAYSVLKNANLAKIGLDQMPTWQIALKEYLIEKKYLN
ncbi:MAG: dTDP-4-dehydrorhamnose reductase [Candidatus Margulisiibacteriota bacterium]